jgi:hypothetical protein
MNEKSKRVPVLLSEHRACPSCVTTRVRCELGVRPCSACRDTQCYALIKECIVDCTVMKRACKECRAHRKSCNKKRPCERCTKKGLPCTPYNPREQTEPSAEIYLVSDISEVLRFYLENENSVVSESTDGEPREQATLEDESSCSELLRILTPPSRNSLAAPNYILAEPPALWDTAATFEICKGLIHDVSPLGLFDSLASMQLPKLEFYYKSFCQFLSPALTSTLFHYTFQTLESSFPGMENQIRSLLDSKLRSFSLQMLTTESSVRDLEHFISTILPPVTQPIPSFEPYEVKEISNLLLKFKEEFCKHFDTKLFQRPAYLIRKFNHVTKQINLFHCNEMGQLVGPFHDRISILNQRELRDRQWLSRTSPNDRLITGILA